MKKLLSDMFLMLGFAYMFVYAFCTELLGEAGNMYIFMLVSGCMFAYMVWSDHTDRLKRQAEIAEKRAAELKIKEQEADRIAREDYYARTGHRV